MQNVRYRSSACGEATSFGSSETDGILISGFLDWVAREYVVQTTERYRLQTNTKNFKICFSKSTFLLLLKCKHTLLTTWFLGIPSLSRYLVDASTLSYVENSGTRANTNDPC